MSRDRQGPKMLIQMRLQCYGGTRPDESVLVRISSQQPRWLIVRSCNNLHVSAPTIWRKIPTKVIVS